MFLFNQQKFSTEKPIGIQCKYLRKIEYFEGSNAGHKTDFKRTNLIWVPNFRVRQRRQGIRNRSSMTNCKSSSLFQIILNSMHRFQPRIYLVVRPEGANHPITDIEQEKYRTYIFPETIFTAVTAYQNQLVSFLKMILLYTIWKSFVQG